MNPSHNSQCPRRARCGAFTLIEMLMVLAILGVLLSALAGAFYTCLHSYEENGKIAEATQAARSALDRMARDIRILGEVNVDDWQTVTIIPYDPAQGQRVQYAYDPTEQKLYYRTTTAGTTTSQVLLGQGGLTVPSFTAVAKLGLDSNNVNCVRTVRLRLVVEVDSASMALNASAAPRRNQTY